MIYFSDNVFVRFFHFFPFPRRFFLVSFREIPRRIPFDIDNIFLHPLSNSLPSVIRSDSGQVSVATDLYRSWNRFFLTWVGNIKNSDQKKRNLETSYRFLEELLILYSSFSSRERRLVVPDNFIRIENRFPFHPSRFVSKNFPLNK